MNYNATFDSPESAAMDGFPPEHCRVIASRVQADRAYVLLNTGSTERPYLSGVSCRRENDRWIEEGSASVPGWQQTDHDPDLGTMTLWGDAPANADLVRVEFDGHITDEPVSEAAYLVVWWRVPFRRQGPKVRAFRVAGRWLTT
jgi:hypothetical protein